MKAVLINDYGPADNIVLGELPKPEPGPREVRVKVAYCGLRWSDIMARNGIPSRARKPPFLAGSEATGVVDALGPEVKGYALGQRVMAMALGSWAEYICVPEMLLVPIPERVGLDQMLAYPVNMLTAYLAVNVWAKVQPGERVLLHAAAGGVGSLALQIMKRKLKDVTVIALVGSDEKVDLVRKNGADYAINYKKTDYVEEVNRLFGPKATGLGNVGASGGGVDVSINGVGGPTLKPDSTLIRKRGRFVIFGHSAGPRDLDIASMAYDSINVMPYSMLTWLGTPEHAAGNAFIREWLETEELVQPTVYPLERAAEVERAMEQGLTSGKVVFKV